MGEAMRHGFRVIKPRPGKDFQGGWRKARAGDQPVNA
jgi:hypothetical protein